MSWKRMWDKPRKVTPTEALAMMKAAPDEFREKILNGDLIFSEKYIKSRPRIRFFGWRPYIHWTTEATDGKTTIRFD